MDYNRENIVAMLKEHVHSTSLQKHSYAVEGGMAIYAKHFGEDEAKYRAVGLLHDWDYEEHPDTHPALGLDWLAERGFDAEFIQAVKGHAEHDVSERPTKIAKTLFAVDELSSFIVAVALMRPTKFDGMKVKSVTKKLKDKRFAAAVNREEIKRAAAELGVELNEHIQRVITGLQEQQAFLESIGQSLV